MINGEGARKDFKPRSVVTEGVDGARTTKVTRKYYWRCDVNKGGNKLKQTSISLFLKAKRPTAGGDDTILQQGDSISMNSAGQVADRRCIPDNGAGMERFGESEDETIV